MLINNCIIYNLDFLIRYHQLAPGASLYAKLGYLSSYQHVDMLLRKNGLSLSASGSFFNARNNNNIATDTEWKNLWNCI